MYRRLLIPVSEPAEVEPLIRFGAALLDTDGEIRVLHVIPTTTLPEVTRQWRASVNLVIPAHEAGAALDVRVDPEVRASVDVAGEIIESAQTHSIDAILMTLAGDRRSRNPFLGHTSTSVLHHAPCDVLVVNRLALIEEKVQRLLIPTFSAAPPQKALRIAEELSVRNRGAPIILLGIGARGDELGPGSSGRSPRGIPVQVHKTFLSRALLGRRRRLPEIILHQAALERYGLLLLGEEHLNSEAPLLTRRFLEELFRGAPCPVIAVRG
ncbi:MAG: universal stress protein [Thermoplasmata archaeon]|nr:universal stress protein [Thermoplasmata archaeon]